jgi:hypothetical protein
VTSVIFPLATLICTWTVPKRWLTVVPAKVPDDVEPAAVPEPAAGAGAGEPDEPDEPLDPDAPVVPAAPAFAVMAVA